MRFWQYESFRQVGLQQRRGKHLAGEVRGFIRIAFAAARTAPKPVRSVVLGKHVGKALDLSRVRGGEDYLRAAAHQFLNFLDQCRHRAVETSRRLRKERGFW